jgi:hypothetical protein
MPCFNRAALRLAVVFAATVFCAAAARAIPQTFVSVSGNNANTCERTAPCRTFAGALIKTGVNGEIIVLDAGEYGVLSITKSVKVTAVGVYAAIRTVAVVSGGNKTAENAVSVSSTQDIKVALRGLTLIGAGINMGVAFNAQGGGTLSVEDCTISGFKAGISNNTRSQVQVKDTVVRNNEIGISVNVTGGGTATLAVDHCRLENNFNGLSAQTGPNYGSAAKVLVRDSLAAGNVPYGFSAVGPGTEMTVEGSAASGSTYGFVASKGAKLNVKNSASANNQFGLYVTDAGTKATAEGCALNDNSNSGLLVRVGAVASVSDSAVTGNAIGLRNEPASPGTLKTFGNSRVDGNTTNVSGALTPASQM